MTTPLSASLLRSRKTIAAVAFCLEGGTLLAQDPDAAVILDAIMEQYGGQMPPQYILLTTKSYAVNWSCGGWPDNLWYWTNREYNTHLHRTTSVGLVYMLLHQHDLLPLWPRHGFVP